MLENFFKILGRISFVSICFFLLNPALADYTPQSPKFPHGQGIKRAGKYLNGLNFPSFNNFVDTTINSKFAKGITDERRFLALQNLGPRGKKTNNPYFGNIIKARIGDYIYARAYIHNNGHINDSKTIARKVKTGITGFSKIEKHNYASTSGKRIVLQQFIHADNATPKTVTDDAIVVSETGQPIKLEYYAKGQVQTSISLSGVVNRIDPETFITGGAKIGDVKGCSEESFYIWSLFKVIDGTPPKYNLVLDQTVGKSVKNAVHKKITASAGDILTYKLSYKNELFSAHHPIGTKIYVDYDQRKLQITWLPDNPKKCTDNGDIITCDAYDLSPVTGMNKHHFYYKGMIKRGAKGKIINRAEIKPKQDKDINNSDDISSSVVYIE